MAVITGSVLYDLLALLVVLFGILTWYLNSNFNYWKKRGVYYLKPEPYFGNFRKVLTLRKNLGESIQELYQDLGDHKYGGAFRLRYPIFIVKDPDLVKQIMVKDYQHFQGRGFRVDPENDPLSQHLFNLSGPVWRKLRTKLTPTFTSGKMKMMFQLMEECCNQLKDYLSEYAENGSVLEMKEVLAKFTTDIIGSCAFGLQCNSMANPDSEFRQMGKKIFQTNSISMIQRFLAVIIPQLASIFKVTLIEKDVTEFFLKVVSETVDYREKNNVERNDFLQLLIQLKNKGKVEDDHHDIVNTEKDIDNHTREDTFELTDSLLAAQVFVFFLAGFETSSTTMSFALYELALNPDIQSRLREEVDNTLQECDGKVTYEAIQKMEYMDRVIAETLRKYPPAANLLRECTIPYKVPDSNLVIEKGVLAIIPVFGMQRDPKYYPDPEKFDPERFTEENKAKRHHFTYLPFGEGPRICIGMRFGLLQSKLGLFTLLSNYEFSVCEGTEIPVRFDPKTPITSSTTGTILKITNRT